MSGITGISAITLTTRDMARAVAFFEALGFRLDFGGPEAPFTTLWGGPQALNLTAVAPDSPAPGFWGRVIFHVEDVDAMYRRARAAGFAPEFEPRDAPWGERYFHLLDPDGHELSFARPLADRR
jgi:catechol 2,3-dioxygenase-like lactoylglutathione lyase family enzyme